MLRCMSMANGTRYCNFRVSTSLADTVSDSRILNDGLAFTTEATNESILYYLLL